MISTPAAPLRSRISMTDVCRSPPHSTPNGAVPVAAIAPAYLPAPWSQQTTATCPRRQGRPATLDSLKDHLCLVHATKDPSAVWTFARAGQTVAVPVQGSLCSNAQEVLYGATLAGEGISLQPLALVEADLEAGTLERVVPDAVPAMLEMRAFYTQRRYLPARIRLFVDHLTLSMQRSGNGRPGIDDAAWPDGARSPRDMAAPRPAVA